jgi:hypothetical protein
MPYNALLEQFAWTLNIDGASSGLVVEIPGDIQFETEKTAEEFPNLCTGTTTQIHVREDIVDRVPLTVRVANPDDRIAIRDTLKNAWKAGKLCTVITPGGEETLDLKFDATRPFNVRWGQRAWWISFSMKNIDIVAVGTSFVSEWNVETL